ncbi:hypothetical protein FGW37_22435 [Streptomyces rectiverticillatus]|uniref:hypothetical protein n=1 Tax=Streptomyces rectiverticillatus TaxID=173860 RepID=UPI0015C408D8|nr:hypothetical protein [Streptomyces rectiverticillatus]QLE73970.1 hypothetical protein FGW37_22435 [Streptomyces rectiverticillatus]
MRTYVVHRPVGEALEFEFEDSAYEFEGLQGPETEDFRELFLGRPGEPAEERAAKLSSVAAMKSAASVRREARAGRAA